MASAPFRVHLKSMLWQCQDLPFLIQLELPGSGVKSDSFSVEPRCFECCKVLYVISISCCHGSALKPLWWVNRVSLRWSLRGASWLSADPDPCQPWLGTRSDLSLGLQCQVTEA